MKKTLEEKSRILKLKSKFFLTRAVSYSSFLLIPVWLPKLIELSNLMKLLVILVYVLFVMAQMFLLGKEVDHRLGIYFKVTSSAEKMVYRIFMGMFFFILYFGFLGLFPPSLYKHFYWGTWIFLGLFYSWPTRGKIIEDTMSGHLIEFKFLDAFEKTVLGLTTFVFLISVPKIHYLENVETLKLYFDPSEKIAPLFWSYLSVNYFPFYKFPQLFKMAYWLHFYVMGVGLFGLAFYSLTRHFMSRRLALLGVFSIVSSWSFSKYLGHNLNFALFNTFSVIWVWGFFWGHKSSTYRSGLMIGLIGLYGTIINKNYFILLLVQQLAYYFFLFPEKTNWYKRQFIKYSLLGTMISLAIILSNLEGFLDFSILELSSFASELTMIIQRKAFFSISILGPGLFIFFLLNNKKSIGEKVYDPLLNFKRILLIIFLLLIYAVLIDACVLQNFGLMWIVSFFSLMPLEWIFQTIRRMRSRRNMIYLIYILACLLDSHIEGRIKILLDLLKNG